jgi:hypothetical protein
MERSFVVLRTISFNEIVKQKEFVITHSEPEIVFLLSEYIKMSIPAGLTANEIAKLFVEQRMECWPAKVTCYKLIGFQQGIFEGNPIFSKDEIVGVTKAANNPNLICKLSLIESSLFNFNMYLL